MSITKPKDTIALFQTIIQEKFCEIESTHSYAINKTNLKKNTLYAIVADRQTKGYGRRGSPWVSVEGNLYVSMTFLSDRAINVLSHALTYTLLRTLHALGIEVQFKWPNDLLFEGKKICGILCHKKGGHITLSFGLNVNTVVTKRICMSQITQKKYDLDALFSKILQEFRVQFSNNELSVYISKFRDHLAFKGQMISYEVNQAQKRARLVNITDEGLLVVQAQGQTLRLSTASNIAPLKEHTDRACAISD